MKYESKRDLITLFIWAILMSGTYFIIGIKEPWDLLASVWICLIIAGILVFIGDEFLTRRKPQDIPEEKRILFEGYDFYELGKSHFLKKEFDKAITYLDKAIERGVTELSFSLRAECLQELDYHLDAIDDFDIAISMDKNDCNLFF